MFLSPFRLQSNRPDGPKIGARSPAARNTLAKAAILGNSRVASFENSRLRPICSPPPRRVVYLWASITPLLVVMCGDSATQRKILPGFWQFVERACFMRRYAGRAAEWDITRMWAGRRMIRGMRQQWLWLRLVWMGL